MLGSGEAINVWKISLLQIRMLVKNLVLAHPRAKPAEHIPDSNTKARGYRAFPRASPARP